MAKTKMDSKLLVFKLKTNMFQNSNKELKKFKTKKIAIFLLKVLMKLLDGFWFRNFKTSHVFKSVKEVNEFVLEYARNKVTFHGNIVDTMLSKRCPSSNPMY
jgi:hypothetical protein